MKTIMQWLGRYVPVRQRNILTRKNGLRLRYIALPAALFIAGLLAMIASFATTQHRKMAISVVTSPYYALSSDYKRAKNKSYRPEEEQRVRQKRLQRYKPDKNLQTAKRALAQNSFMPETRPLPREKILKIGKGDTLAGVLQKAGVGASESYKAVLAMEKYYDPRKIRPGQKIQVRFDPTISQNNDLNSQKKALYHLTTINLGIDEIKSVNLTLTEGHIFKSSLQEKEVIRKTYTNKANIETSLYGSAEKAGIPTSVIAQAIHIFSWDVDFQRDIRKGDLLEVMYEQLETVEGTKVKGSTIIYVRLNVNGHDIPVYRFKTGDGDIDYFTEDGVSLRKALMQTPIDGARLSSGFGLRKHPVLGYNKMHKGVDFAAPRGTPIYAAGDGTIERASPFSSYGNYIRIRHNASLKTAYAHMRGFAKGVRVGKRIKQGQVIGYVGTTGRSTGPHLHYEVLKNNKQINPKTINLPQGETLKNKELAAFKSNVKKLKRKYSTLTKKTTLASNRAPMKS